MPLTALAVRQARPGSRARKLYDAGGLYLLVNPSGGKYWRLKYRHAAKEKVLALGVYPETSLAAARDRRDAARQLLRAGGDPGAERRTEKRLSVSRTANSFEAVAREWHEKQAGRWAATHAAQVLKSLGTDVFPAIGDRIVSEISPAELLDVLRAIEQRGALDMASRALQRTSAVFRYAVQTGRAQVNPATELRGTLKTRRVVHMAALAREDLPGFLAKLAAYDGHALTRLALHFLVLTFVRSRELREAQWSEFDLPAAIWRIPAERMKMGSPHLVPLSRQAIEVLEKIQRLTGRFGFVFPATTNVRRPMSENTLLYAMYRMGYHGRGTPHGFRATASTILNEEGFSSDAIERQLAHAERNKVRAAYHRSEHLPERKRLMQAWADFLDSIAQDQRPTLAVGGK